MSTTYSRESRTRQQSTGWTGWVIFAGVMLLIGGIFQSIAGFTALFDDEYFLVGSNGLIVSMDYTAWGWVHLGIGALLIIGGMSLFAGGMTGRVLGVIVASLSAIVNLAFLAAYPAWSILIITIDILVIYSIIVHGRELNELD